MKPNIVFLDEYSLGGADLAAIRSLGNYTAYETTRPAEIVGRCREADIVITNKVPFDAATLRALPRLRLICIAATGMNHIDLAAAAECGVHYPEYGLQPRRALYSGRQGLHHACAMTLS